MRGKWMTARSDRSAGLLPVETGRSDCPHLPVIQVHIWHHARHRHTDPFPPAFRIPGSRILLSPRNLLMIVPVSPRSAFPLLRASRSVPEQAARIRRPGRYLPPEAPAHSTSFRHSHVDDIIFFQIDLRRTSRPLDHDDIRTVRTAHGNAFMISGNQCFVCRQNILAPACSRGPRR